jgi:hypothetical protein
LCYESGFLALFALPLLVRAWDRRTPGELIRHALLLSAVLAAVVALRFLVGEGRATTSAGGVAAILPPLLGSLVLGPARSIGAMVYGPFKAIPGWDLEVVVAAVVALVGVGALLLRVQCAAKRGTSVGEPIQVGVAGLAMLVLGYGLAFTHFPPNAIVGRGTSVHLGATLGMSVLAAGVAWLLLSLRPRLAAAAIAAYLAVVVGYYVTIERDFIRSWQLQRAFWQQVIACCSDLQDGTVLLYELNPADEPTFIFSNSWADPLVLGETMAFPRDWTQPPRLFSLTRWLDRVEPEGDHLRWWVPGASWDEHWEVLPNANVILLQRGPDGTLVRATGSIDTPGHPLELKPPGPPIKWPPAQLYGLLLE